MFKILNLFSNFSHTDNIEDTIEDISFEYNLEDLRINRQKYKFINEYEYFTNELYKYKFADSDDSDDIIDKSITIANELFGENVVNVLIDHSNRIEDYKDFEDSIDKFIEISKTEIADGVFVYKIDFLSQLVGLLDYWGIKEKYSESIYQFLSSLIITESFSKGIMFEYKDSIFRDETLLVQAVYFDRIDFLLDVQEKNPDFWKEISITLFEYGDFLALVIAIRDKKLDTIEKIIELYNARDNELENLFDTLVEKRPTFIPDVIRTKSLRLFDVFFIENPIITNFTKEIVEAIGFESSLEIWTSFLSLDRFGRAQNAVLLEKVIVSLVFEQKWDYVSIAISSIYKNQNQYVIDLVMLYWFLYSFTKNEAMYIELEEKFSRYNQLIKSEFFLINYLMTGTNKVNDNNIEKLKPDSLTFIEYVDYLNDKIENL